MKYINMKYIIIIIIILISLYLIMDVNENFYTYFIPFLKTNKSNTKVISYKQGIRDNIKIGIVTKPTESKLDIILKRFIKNTIFYNFTILIDNLYTNIERKLINNYLDIGILNVPFIYSKINNIFNHIEFICNFSTSTIFFIYNKKNLGKIYNIDDIITPITTLKYNYSICNLLLPNNKLSFVSNNDNLIDYILSDNSNVIMFIDANPSNVFKNILVKDIENNLDIIPIHFKNINKKLGNYIFYQNFIKVNEETTKYIKIRNQIHETIFFYNGFYCKKNYDSYIIYNFVKEMFKNIKLLDKNIVLNNFAFNPPFIKINEGSLKYFTEINLLANINNPKCGEIIGKLECTEKILKNIKFNM